MFNCYANDELSIINHRGEKKQRGCQGSHMHGESTTRDAGEMGEKIVFLVGGRSLKEGYCSPKKTVNRMYRG